MFENVFKFIVIFAKVTLYYEKVNRHTHFAVDRCVENIECTAGRGKLHIQIDGIVKFDLQGCKRVRIVTEHFKREIVLGQNPDGPFDPKMTAIVFKNTKGDFFCAITEKMPLCPVKNNFFLIKH